MAEYPWSGKIPLADELLAELSHSLSFLLSHCSSRVCRVPVKICLSLLRTTEVVPGSRRLTGLT